MKNLFLTGAVGCGKSTSLTTALGENLAKAGGFLTVRQRDEAGKPVAFWLTRPDGSERKQILDLSDKSNPMRLEVFSDFGVRLLDEARNCEFVILDEIGGFEMLSDSFMDALMHLLESETPIIGVMKGEEPAGKMIQKLGLGDHYVQKAELLRQWLRQDKNTLLYDCGQFDPEGLRLAIGWVSEHIKDKKTASIS